MGLADLSARIGERVASRDAVRADPVTLEEFGYLLGNQRGGGRSRAGVNVNERTAAGLPTWLHGVRYLSVGVGYLPCRVYRDTAAGRVERAKPPWMVRPDVELSWKSTVEFVVASVVQRGNAYLGKLRSEATGQVTGLRVIHPDRVRVEQANDGTKIFEVDRQPYTSREILHVLGPLHNGVVGLDVLTAQTDTIGRAKAADDYASGSLGASDMTQRYLSVPGELTRDQAEELYRQYVSLHQGRDGRRFAVMANGAELRTVALTPEQAQLLETRRFSVIEFAQILGIPPHKLYELSRATFSNIEHQAIEAVADSLQPLAERVEDAFNEDRDLLPRGNFIEFSLEGKLRGDAQSRTAFYSAGIRDGWLQPAQVAALENLPVSDELRYWQRPLNVAVVRPGQPEEVPSEQAPA